YGSNQFNQVIPIDINNDSRDELFANNGKDLYAFRNNGTGIVSPSGLLVSNFGYFPAVYCYVPYLNDSRLAAFYNGQSSSSIGMFKIGQSNLTDTSITMFSYSLSSPSVVFDSSKLVLGFSNGFVYEKNLTANQGAFMDTTNPGPVNRFTKENSLYRTARGSNLNIISGNFRDKASLDSLLQVSISDVKINGTGINKYGINFSNIIAADINKDGKQEVIFTFNNFIYAVNSNGILLDNFPLKSKFSITSGISIVDVNDDGIFDIIYVNSNGDLNAVGINGKSVDGFPYMIGPGTVSTPAVFNYSDTLAIAVLSADGYLYAFRTNKLYKHENVLWKNYLRDRNLSNNNFRGITAPNSYSEKLPNDKVYNWPNPVYDNVTYIRYYINGSSSGVTVRIMDLSGELVAKLTGTANPDAENEVAWNVSGVQSGIYYGVVEANIDGSTETKIIKIAVVK
ncbi:MAG: T9SS type A sorting domain-containing protein, partial [Ignavibacteria bacterium]|nr:T9SS type A sorting domain-containing protein [Ignavibacteria bacterium]